MDALIILFTLDSERFLDQSGQEWLWKRGLPSEDGGEGWGEAVETILGVDKPVLSGRVAADDGYDGIIQAYGWYLGVKC